MTTRVAYAPVVPPSSLPQTAQQQVSPYCISGDAHPSPTTRIACHPSVCSAGRSAKCVSGKLTPQGALVLGFQWLPREYVPRHLSHWCIAPFYASISFYWRMCAGMAAYVKNPSVLSSSLFEAALSLIRDFAAYQKLQALRFLNICAVIVKVQQDIEAVAIGVSNVKVVRLRDV